MGDGYSNMTFRSRLPSQPVLFAALMIIMAVLSLTPPRWVGWVRGLVQVLGLPQWAATSAGRAIRDTAAEAMARPPTVEEVRALQAENSELRRLVGQQGQWLEDLEGRLAAASRIREELGDADAELVIAPVSSYDSSPRRESLLIGRGAAAGVERGQWVAAGLPEGQRTPGESGQQTLLRQWLIGRVSETYPRFSRVLLVSDPKFEEEFREGVSLARVGKNGRWEATAANYVLHGRGAGRMVIPQADKDYRREGYDYVLAKPSLSLPIGMTVGRIIGSRPTNESALHFDLEVQPWSSPQDLRTVYVIRVVR